MFVRFAENRGKFNAITRQIATLSAILACALQHRRGHAGGLAVCRRPDLFAYLLACRGQLHIAGPQPGNRREDDFRLFAVDFP